MNGDERIRAHPDGKVSVAFSPDGRWLATGSTGMAHTWALEEGVESLVARVFGQRPP